MSKMNSVKIPPREAIFSVKYPYTLDFCRRFSRLIQFRCNAAVTVILPHALAAILAVSAVVLLVLDPDVNLTVSIAVLVAAAFYIFFVDVLQWRMMAKSALLRYAETGTEAVELTAEFSEEGITLISPSESDSVAYGAVSSATVSGDILVLSCYRGRSFIPIGLGGLSGGERERLLAFLRGKAEVKEK